MTKTQQVSNNSTTNKRFKMSVVAFLFFSIAGGGFILNNIVKQFTAFYANTMMLYLIATLIYSIPYACMMFEFMSIKKIKKAESGYQSWLNVVVGKKYGFFGSFFYFFVNLFFFLDLAPQAVTYILFTVLPESIVDSFIHKIWFKPIIGIFAIGLFWLATYISANGPKWMSKIASACGFAGLSITVLFLISAIVTLIVGPVPLNGKTGSFKIIDKNLDISWAKLGSISWALQSLGGMEALAAYKNNVKGGERGFKKSVVLYVVVFSTLILIISILAQSVLPTQDGKATLLKSMYQSFYVMHFPAWWTNIIAAFLLLTTFGGSLMIWTAAPVKILLSDAPKGIFGAKLSKVTKEGTPKNGLILQGIIVSVLITLSVLAELNSGMHSLLKTIRNIDGGAATFPVLFLIFAYIKLRIQGDKPKYERSFHFLGKSKIWAILAVIPMLAIFAVATVTSLFPDPSTFSKDLVSSILKLVIGPLGILAAWFYCEYIWRKWRRKNPTDNSLYNETLTKD